MDLHPIQNTCVNPFVIYANQDRIRWSARARVLLPRHQPVHTLGAGLCDVVTNTAPALARTTPGSRIYFFARLAAVASANFSAMRARVLSAAAIILASPAPLWRRNVNEMRDPDALASAGIPWV